MFEANKRFVTFGIQSLLTFATALLVFGAEPVVWIHENGQRYHPVNPGTGERAEGFTRMAAASTGVQFTNILTERLVAMNRVTENGSGVALGDVDGDSWCDIYFCGLEGDNVIYRNLGGWKFTNVTREAGIALENELTTGATFADIDGDGDLDLLANSIGGGTRSFFNDSKGKFSENNDGRLVRRFGSTSMALGDIDQDGDLDLYVANYRTIVGKDEFPRAKVEARRQGGEIVVHPPGRYVALDGAKGGNVDIFELAERDFLYVNDGKGRYAPVSWTTGNFLDEGGRPLTSVPLDWALSVMMRDINDDGLIDILVCNDFFNSPDRIWIQQKGLRFQLASAEAIRKVSLASMAVDVADINRDGLDDLFFVEMLGRDYAFRQSHRDNLMKAAFNLRTAPAGRRWEISRNTLFLNMGGGTYAEVAEMAGLDASEWSWGAVFLDVDLDGWEDVLVPTGHNHDVQNADVLRKLGQSNAPDSIDQRVRDLSKFPKLQTPIMAFRNGGQLRFAEKQDEWGLNIPGVVNGFACADLDNDGDLDLVANRLNGEALLLRNDTRRERIGIRLAGQAPNTRGVGAKLTVRGGPVTQTQEMIGAGRYLSNDDTIRVFAGKGIEPMTIEVRWPNGSRTTAAGLVPNRVYEIREESARSESPRTKETTPFFSEVNLDHRHSDPSFDDFERQPFLHYSLSTQGPALAWADVDDDGLDDLIVGGARGGQMAIRQNTGGAFVSVTNVITNSRLVEDQAGVLAVRLGTNGLTLLSANSNYESGGTHSPSIELRTSRAHAGLIPGTRETTGVLALADIDGDGDLDLFAGGRVVPGRYPAAASSRIYRNDGGAFVLDSGWSKPFENTGLVPSAQFSDFNNDARPDLVVAVEWGGILVYVNEGGRFVPGAFGTETKRGWWTSVATGDFNNDGRTDIVAGNWGRNTKYERFLRDKPLHAYHGDLDGNGKYDVVKAIFNPGLKKFVPLAGPEMIIDHFPAAAERIPTYEAYAQASVGDVIGGATGSMLEIDTMESMHFINTGAGKFEGAVLPIEAQFAPVFGMAAADFDNDGNCDLVLGQNLFDTRWDLGRLDSGRPLWLRGDGTGKFSTVLPPQSGLDANGQQRAVAISDFNRDGRMDVAFSQNNGETKLFANRKGEPGLRLRFEGGEFNPDAIGLRYSVSNGGPARIHEVQAGGGWLSQNSFVQVIKRPTRGAQLQVQWPGGKRTEFELPENAKELLVSASGVKVVR